MNVKPESDLGRRVAALSPAKRATLMQRLLQRGDAPDRDRIPRRDAQRPARFSSSQESLWFLAALEPESRAYNLGKAYHLNGPLNVKALEKGVEEILRRHEALRTTFAFEHGNPVQVIVPPGPLTLPFIDLSKTPRERRFEDAMRWAEAECSIPFDLKTGPLLRAALLHLDELENVLVLAFHHIVFDGWSGGVFDRELSAFYSAFSQGRVSDWPDPPIQYADYAAWQRLRLSGGSLEVHLAFWRNQLAGASLLSQLSDRPHPARPLNSPPAGWSARPVPHS